MESVRRGGIKINVEQQIVQFLLLLEQVLDQHPVVRLHAPFSSPAMTTP